MFRISQYMKEMANNPKGDQALPKARTPSGPVVIWNLIRRCNLTCKHCYSISADINFPGELSTQQVFDTLDDLWAYGTRVLILSGGEPLLRDDIWDISIKAREMGFYVGLSTNGTLIDENNIDRIVEMDYDYVGISIDGIESTHDEFRQLKGAYESSMHAISLCKQRGIKVGMRFTPTQHNAHELPLLIELMDKEKVDKLYISHLNYGGRGNKNRKTDVVHKTSRWVMDTMFEAAWEDAKNGGTKEYVTGNNDADGVYLLRWVAKNQPQQLDYMRQRLEQWGGNASGKWISNIDNLGNVHPDTFWWNYNLGNVKTRPFSEIWDDLSDPLMAGLKQDNRQLGGRCGVCKEKAICGGNTRIRAFQTTGDPWWEDPACYMYDDELGIQASDYENEKPQPLDLKTRKIKRAS
ncbi:MAG: heme d1 biosynthesis radical SAM protein NirJ [bacterium]